METYKLQKGKLKFISHVNEENAKIKNENI